MIEETKPERWFCRRTPDADAEGPFDQVNLAILLRDGDITGETLTRKEGEESWVAFKDTREFETAKTMPAKVICQRLKDEAGEQLAPWWTPRRLYYLVWLLFGVAGYALFGGIRPTWQMHWFQKAVWDEISRLLGHS